MISSDVIDLYSSLENLGVEIWIDGGWGVDALLGEQSRSHQDLDIAIEEKDVPKLKEMLCVIEGRAVRCISPEWVVKFHSGYKLKDKDFRDVHALCTKFGIELPSEYKDFKR